MRLTQFEIQSIVNTFHEVFRNGEIYLFGSRTDDTKKGGENLKIFFIKINMILKKCK